MDTIAKDKLDYLQPIEIADGIYWIGFKDEMSGINCNPYLIVEGDEAVVIDGGSRDEFSTVMLKILRVGVGPKNIKRLIYTHSDPDLCGNLPQLEALIDSEDLRIISQKENNTFINYFSSKTPKLCIKDLNYEYVFKSGRKLQFIPVPYSHAPGSFIIYDVKTKTLFSSDLFGGFDNSWSLYQKLDEVCYKCSEPREDCPFNKKCRLSGIMKFHQSIMNSARALNYALDKIEAIDIKLIAPQHGSLIDEKEKKIIIKHLRTLKNIGFDYFIQEKNNESIGKLLKVSG